MFEILFSEITFPQFRSYWFELPGFTLFNRDFGPFPLRWYALSYITGLALGWLYIRRMMMRPALWGGGEIGAPKGPPLEPRQTEDLFFWMTLGVVLGGRLGFVLFYEPQLIWLDPVKILRIWDGGMAFHGGLLGVVVGVVLYARALKTSVLSVGDAVACAAPIGLFLGRIANFINGELWGRPTELPWGMRFPQVEALADDYPWLLINGENVPRHPSQLYEAALEGLVLFAILAVLAWRRGALKTPGLCIGVFLIGYGVARFLVEFVRQWNVEGGLDDYLLFELTRGQTLCLPMIAAGLAFAWAARRRAAAEPTAPT